MAYEIVWEPPYGVIKHFSGLVTGKEILAAVEEVGANENLDRLRSLINDFSNCRSISITDQELEEVSAIHSASFLQNPRIHVAFVATEVDVVSAASAFSRSPFNSCPTRIFSSIEDARDWLRDC